MDTGGISRISYTTNHHFIIGMDPSHQYIVASCADKDTDPPVGLGDEDRRSLWIYDLDSQEITRLTDDENTAEGDSFSPDGEWIVFHMRLANEAQTDLYKIMRNGSDLTRLTQTPDVLEADPCWSHDGKRIVYTSFDIVTPRFVLKIMDADGGSVQELYDGGEGVATAAFPPGNYDPSWSPDDQWIVFERAMNYSGQNWDSGVWHIFKIRSDGTNIIDLSIAGNHSDRAEYLPSFSPNGDSIIFGSLYETNESDSSFVDVFKMDADGTSPLRLTFNDASDMFPIWIP
ncbi:MAG: PD40 domain-containing protein [Candidatus Thermoplasmatota archaeon]|nr:PD40 domain-containing protein [Candidatus Thermoplasmatota archaeon]